MSLVREQSAIPWELRSYWASRRAVRVTMSERCVIRTVCGTVDSVAATGAFAVVDGWHLPLDDIVALGKPTPEDRDRYRAASRAAIREHYSKAIS